MGKGKNKTNQKQEKYQQEKNRDEKKDVEQVIEKEKWKQEQIREEGSTVLNENEEKHNIQLITIIGEVEGHDVLGNNTKATKYEHILPALASIEDSSEIEGVLILLNTMGGDVEAGLAIAEMISSLSKPTVSLVLGGSHSIGVPIAVSSDYSYIVPTGTMVIHPVRLSGLVIGAQPTFDYFRQMQNRIIHFVSSHCKISPDRMEELMMETGMLTKDVGTILVGREAVEEGIINEVGGIAQAVSKLHEMIGKR
ncbi:MAG: ATP-dependent Clp protease proteolytic subunit [Lachnospiraceae bacterium]|nr:ATP-dependent Clp protease proteolytic subunit [Lachnospiraceae bacterium]MDY4096169.1 ATP-dependent Clp protease proteolytic subunit [Lachnospiraceae bacterium]